MTAIKECRCKHKFQDEQYGEGNRVHNFAEKGFNGSTGWRCTVCKDVKSRRQEVVTNE